MARSRRSIREDDPYSPRLKTVSSEASNASQTSGLSISNFWQRMMPGACVTRCLDNIVSDDPLEEVVPDLLHAIETDELKKVRALQELYELVDVKHQHNRVPVVCTQQWDILPVLAAELNPDSPGRRWACLILNSLSIPFRNKHAMVLCEGNQDLLIPAFLRLIVEAPEESYLACACLMNLSYLEKAKEPLLYYVPPSPNESNQPKPTVLDNPRNSLLRTLESMIKNYTPALQYPAKSVQREAIRWALGFFKNVATVEDHAVFLAQHSLLPSLCLTLVRDSPRPLVKWTEDSVEDSCLLLLLMLVKVCPQAYDGLNVREHFSNVLGHGGIHDMRASIILCRIDDFQNIQRLRSSQAPDRPKRQQLL